MNEAYLRTLASRLASLALVDQTTLFPETKQESLVVSFRDDFVPSVIDAVQLEIRVYGDGDFHVTYAESYLGERRQCRWDRHDQPHSSRDHFHPLPDARTETAEDCSFPADFDAVLRDEVLPWVDDRIGELWAELDD